MYIIGFFRMSNGTAVLREKSLAALYEQNAIGWKTGGVCSDEVEDAGLGTGFSGFGPESGTPD